MYGAYLVIKKISAKVPGPANSALCNEIIPSISFLRGALYDAQMSLQNFFKACLMGLPFPFSYMLRRTLL